MEKLLYKFKGWRALNPQDTITKGCHWVHKVAGIHYASPLDGPTVCGVHIDKRVDWDGSAIHNGSWWPYVRETSVAGTLPPKPLFKLPLPLP
jgi:hypothetical protein